MTFANHDDGIRTGVRRVSLDKVDDTGDQQLINGKGFEGDGPQKMVRVQSHGFWGNPPEGSEGVIIALGSRSERAYVFGLEHQDHRANNLDKGDVAYGNDPKKVLFQTKGDDLNGAVKGTQTIKAKKFVFDLGGGVTLTMDSDGFHFAGGKVTHNGHDIGATHKHVDAGGAGLSGVPE